MSGTDTFFVFNLMQRVRDIFSNLAALPDAQTWNHHLAKRRRGFAKH
jgi:hypothetical protein